MNADQVEIYYNPFWIQTDIVINGQKQTEDSRLHSLCRDRRLQEWVDPLLPLIRKTLGSKQIDFSFHGLPLDANDLRSAIESYNNDNPGVHFALVKETCLAPEKDRLEQLRSLFAEGMSGPCKKEFAEKLSKPFEQALDPTFEVHVIATMSAGKSTVINAMLGSDLLASANGACTAVVTRVEDCAEAKQVTARRFNRKHEAIGPSEPATRELLEAWNAEVGHAEDIENKQKDEQKTATIIVTGCFPSISKEKERRLVLIDTPGPNSARHPQHRKVTYDAINNETTSMVMFVIDKDITNNADELLQDVSEAMRRGGRRIHDRFVFLYNKIDDFRDRGPNSGESIKSALENIRIFLEQKFKIKNPLVIPTSALTALSLRRCRNGEQLTFDESSDLENFKRRFLHSEDFYNAIEHVSNRLNSLCLDRLRQRLKAATPDEKVELFSGIPIVEEVFNDYLRKYAIPTRIKEAVDSFVALDREMAITKALNDNLSRSTEELRESTNTLAALQTEHSQTEFGLKLKEELSKWQYSLSKTATERLVELSSNAEIIRDKYIEAFNNAGIVSTDKAAKLLEEALDDCIKSDTAVVSGLEKEFHNEFRRVMENFSKKYKNYIETVLNVKFVDDSSLRELHSTVLKLPTVDEMLKKFSKPHVKRFTERVYDPELFRPWTWFVKQTKEHKETLHKVDLSDADIHRYLRNACAKSMKDIDEFKKAAQDAVDSARQDIINILKEVEPRLKALSEDLKAAQQSKTKRVQMLKTNQEKLDWYLHFKDEVQAILKVY